MNESSRRGLLKAAALAVAAGGTPLAGARAQGAASWPSRSVRLICAFAAGGNTDLVARIVAERLSATLGQSVVVENRTGAGGMIGAEAAARSAPDGYTLFLGSLSTQSIHVSLYEGRLPYDPVADFTPISRTTVGTHMLIVHPSVPVRSVAELVAYAKARPGELAYASGGNGTSTHICGEMFRQLAGIELLHVPFRSTAPASTALVAGQVQIMFDSFSSAMPQARAGRATGLAVTSARRQAAAPEVPTMAETLPGFEADTWDGVFGPAKLPLAVVERVDAAVRAALADPALAARLTELGLQPFPAGPAEFAAFQRSEIEKWGRVVRAANIKPD
ncbi:Bug family tripartite tricarboxylate transporter substrate binding protein [Roseomonas populi]|uniref:Tripartite tricarboxylate transporter substrate binding protein n=1 Tax=Roseomonas populi TaxID=3121582 RepID=A0ABT1XBE2_9PROT|nr:tripartite tricarboxylate transporter substrate binding protein [Roseomonas pecuniae]MCR0985437.1 tripartite tricarboxylate transporter substrate binding protein [Roseomonas pecuniae]